MATDPNVTVYPDALVLDFWFDYISADDIEIFIYPSNPVDVTMSIEEPTVSTSVGRRLLIPAAMGLNITMVEPAQIIHRAIFRQPAKRTPTHVRTLLDIPFLDNTYATGLRDINLLNMMIELKSARNDIGELSSGYKTEWETNIVQNASDRATMKFINKYKTYGYGRL